MLLPVNIEAPGNDVIKETSLEKVDLGLEPTHCTEKFEISSVVLELKLTSRLAKLVDRLNSLGLRVVDHHVEKELSFWIYWQIFRENYIHFISA